MAAYRRVYTHVTCRLTAKNRDQLRNPTLGYRVCAAFTFTDCACCQCSSVTTLHGAEHWESYYIERG